MKNNKLGKKPETYFEIVARKKREIVLDIISKDINRKVISDFRIKNNIPEEGLGAGYGFKIAHLVEYAHLEGLAVGNLEGIDKLVDRMECKENLKTEIDKKEMSALLFYYIVFGQQGLDMHLYSKDNSNIIFSYPNGDKESFSHLNVMNSYDVNRDYPLAIRFKPTITQNELILFIKENFKDLIRREEIRLIGKPKIIRRKTTRDIRDCVWVNREESIDKIKELLDEKFGVIKNKLGEDAYGTPEIRVILDQEKKRRQ